MRLAWRESLRQLAKMGWHCITVWECELKPAKREETLESRKWLNALKHKIVAAKERGEAVFLTVK